MTFLKIILVLCAVLPAMAAVSDDWYAAIRADDLPRLTALTEDADVNLRDTRGETPLMYAAFIGSPGVMKALLDKGADPNAVNEFGATALIWSATDLAKVRLLLDHGADVNAATKRGRTALLIAAMSDNSAEVVRLLLAKGANPKAADVIRTSTLRGAALGNDVETMRLLIGAGVDVNASDIAGITPLMMAAGWNGNTAATKLLLDHGANVNAASAPVMGLPSKNGPSKFGSLTPLLMTAPFGPPELVQTLVDAGANVNAKDVRGMTPLMLAIATDRQDPAILRTLLSHGADASIQSAAQHTAADWASRTGYPAGIELLNVKAIPAAAGPTGAAPLPATRAAAERSLALIEASSRKFFLASGCVSCHAQSMTDLAAGEARTRGLKVDSAAIAERASMLKSVYPPEPLLERFDPAGAQEQLAYPLVGLASVGYEHDRMTDAMAANIAAAQRADGSWHVGAAARPPGEEGDIFRTALCLRSLNVYGTPARAQETRMRVAKARQWLLVAQPRTAEDRNFQLLGLYWAGLDKTALARFGKAILAQQRDGAWSQHEGLPADAYATGESLYALAAAGVIQSKAAAYRSGVDFLLRTQKPDGSWFVASRSPEIQAYFEGGFPYGHDQWISSWGTAWAALALTRAAN